ncbi:transcription initiation factor TFIID subunit [Ostertagia ostertagi]
MYSFLLKRWFFVQDPPNINMRDFINELEDYVPTIPDSVTLHFMRSCGCDCSDPRIVRLIALATQKYVSDIILDAMQQARMKGLGQTKKGTKETRYCLTNDVLEPVLKEYVFEDMENLRRALEERRSDVSISEVKEKYDAWWTKYQNWKEANGLSKEAVITAKKAMRDEQAGLLAALALPNFVHKVGKTEKQMLKKSHHQQYLTQKGHMRVDNEVGVVHLEGYPVLLQNNLNAGCLLSLFSVGHSLFSLVSLFIRAQFLEGKNQWPVTIQSAGVGYHAKRKVVDLAHARQRLKHCVLSLDLNDEQMDEFASESASKIGALLDEGLFLDVKARTVLGKELRNYESQAIVLEDNGLELARVS